MNTSSAKNVIYGKNVQIPTDNNLLSVPEAAELSGKTTETIRRWIHDFEIGKKIGGRYIIYKDKLNKVLTGEITYENQGRPAGKESKKKDC